VTVHIMTCYPPLMSTNTAKRRGSPVEPMRWNFTTASGAQGTVVGTGRAQVGDPIAEGDTLVGMTARFPADEEWDLEIDFAPVDETLEIVRWSYVPKCGSVSYADARVFKKFRQVELQGRIERELRLLQAGLLPSGVSPPKLVTRGRPGRRGHDDLQYAIWVRDYVSAVQREPGRPIALLREEQPGTTASGWRRWLDRAEGLGLLADRPAAIEGRAGGRLTEKAIDLLEGTGLRVPAWMKETRS
jgi:hypothetical protein